MERIDVAIGIVTRARRVLICRRKAKGAFAGYWEFPGGKCEPGETPSQCVVRELREELAIEARPLQALPNLEHDYPHLLVRLHPFICELVRGEPKPIECLQIEWVDPPRLPHYHFPEANEPLLRSLMSILTTGGSRPRRTNDKGPGTDDQGQVTSDK
jgi:mutator protein MutT